MTYRFEKTFAVTVFLEMVLVAFLTMVAPRAQAQHGSEGTVTVTVLDASGSVVPGAQLELQDSATNDVRKADTQENGTYTFVNLDLGKYKLTISKTGFKSSIFPNVVVQAAKTTDIKAPLTVGAVNETVEVTAGSAPLVETTTNAISTTVDLKQIEQLPIQGRDLTQLANIVPGYNGTWDGLPSIAQGNNIDGVIGSTSRMKFSGNAEPNVMPRLENIQEMTVQTEQLNLDQGFGQANMQINFVTRRGGNAFHGRVYEDFRNAALNANSWYNDNVGLPKAPLILNEFGGSLGGPIIKDKLFFFGTFAMGKQPGSISAHNYLFTQAAQGGVFTYGAGQVNLFSLAQNYNATHPGANLPTAPLSDGSGNCSPNGSNSPVEVMCSINASAKYGALSSNANGDPNLQQLGWLVNAPITHYWPTVRVDYDATSKLRFNFAWNMTKDNFVNQNTPDFPGPAWAKTGAGNRDKNYTAAFGFDWTVTPMMVNEFRGGFLYNSNVGAYNAPGLQQNLPQLGWNYTSVGYPYGAEQSGTIFYTGINTYYPVFNASDTVTWQHKAHTINFGFSWWREQDHYYNPVQGFPVVNFGLAGGDPAQNAFQAGTAGTPGVTIPDGTSGEQAEAQQLYAILTGRIQGVTGSYSFSPSQNQYVPAVGRYNLDELQKGWGLFFQDSFRVKPNFTVNYGLRWDFTSADKDLSNLYHSATATAIWGPSGVNNLFNPGSLKGEMNPQITQISQPYNNWNVSPQPALGIAWNPRRDEGFLGKLMGGEKTVIRAGYSLRKFTEPQQYVWNQASDFASFYYQNFFLNANAGAGAGSFTPGSLSIANFNSTLTGAGAVNAFGVPYGLSPKTFLKTEPAADFTFLSSPGLNGIQSNIQQPYTQSWNVGIQRAIGDTRALELRYVGSRTLRQWVTIDPNEVNIFENGFLTQFKQAQANLAANNASGNPNYAGSFANHGLAGQAPTPIFAAAFVGGGEFSPPCADGSAADYCNTQFITQLQTGAAGGMAETLANINGTTPYFCNLVGASFGPCANNIGYTGAGAGYPINFFQTNPYAANTNFVPSAVGTTLSVAEGYSNYNALQVDFRQRSWHGLQFDANYTWSHTLGISSQNNWLASSNIFTLRDMRLTYGPTLYDLRHVVNMNGTYDLPFGKGKRFANRGGVVNQIVGGWTVGTIFTFQTGTPFLLGSNVQGNPNLTFNDYGDAGVALNGVTRSQLQSSVGKYAIPGTPTVAFLNPKYLTPGSGANSAYITQNTTPGTIGQRVWLYGPHATYDDISISKNFPITERVRFLFQTELLNAFNHPVFGPGAGNGGTYGNFQNGFSSNVNSSSFGIGTGPLNPNFLPTGGARLIELRGNIEF